VSDRRRGRPDRILESLCTGKFPALFSIPCWHPRILEAAARACVKPYSGPIRSFEKRPVGVIHPEMGHPFPQVVENSSCISQRVASIMPRWDVWGCGMIRPLSTRPGCARVLLEGWTAVAIATQGTARSAHTCGARRGEHHRPAVAAGKAQATVPRMKKGARLEDRNARWDLPA